jgi:hypothetical protein
VQHQLESRQKAGQEALPDLITTLPAGSAPNNNAVANVD